jgi:glutamate dehydrogenase
MTSAQTETRGLPSEPQGNPGSSARTDLIDRAAATTPHAESARDFLQLYYLHVSVDDLAEMPPRQLADLALSHRDFAGVREPGVAKVRVFSPAASDLTGAFSVVQIVTDDMPFLVDSVTQELSRHDVAIDLVVHPQFVVRRDGSGALTGALGALDSQSDAGTGLVESWIHIEVARQSPRADEQLRLNIERVLSDVRHAVRDWPAMRELARRFADDMESAPVAAQPGIEGPSESAALLRWLADDHFTFLGYREYLLVDSGGHDALAVVPGTGLGILATDNLTSTPSVLPPAASALARGPRPLIVTKANSRSTVHRPAYLDYIGVKTFGPDASVVGERRFLGLFTSSAYSASVGAIPLIRLKVASVMSKSGFAPNSHSGKDLLAILEDHPRDELFQVSVPELSEVALGVLRLQERRRLRLFVRRDVYGRFFSCLVYLPRERYNSQVRLRLKQILLEALGGFSVDDTLRVTESVLARVHFVVHVDPSSRVDVDRASLEQQLVAATRTWNDDLADALSARDVGDDALAERYIGAFPEAYKEDFPASVGVDDIQALERVTSDDGIGLHLYEPVQPDDAQLRLKIYRLGSAVSLSYVLPLLQSMGVEVTDERPYGIERRSGGHAFVYDFGLRAGQVAYHADRTASFQLFQDALAAAWLGRCEVDGFQALVLRAGMTWRQVSVLRAYAKYLRQAGSRYSQEYVENALTANARLARYLVELFETRLDPEFTGDRDAAATTIRDAIGRALDDVSSLDEDRILRSFVTLIDATLRTNYWQVEADAPKPYLALKLASREIADLPLPRPNCEIFVYSPRMEGVHLRFGPVARGGIRYSDRREDFRTEILGLAKTQTVKNAVIVPVGSKGGFVVKKLPADPGDREAQQAEVVYCYRTLIRGLLDLTDNLVETPAGRVVLAPPKTVRHDGDDSYLVVAADKGTATFSDIANEISADYGFWLGDAFASGGSIGYDHKAMGITARGAWESVRRHFRELGVNCQTTDFTCVGIGDMSGDVFGNGMMLSTHTRLVAAFDHRHIFIDPDPDAAISFAERQRLFALPRSSWADYDASLISTGGGVWSRSAKSITVSPEAAAALGVRAGAHPPADLIRGILRAPVDLLWNGGIGTYVKSSAESNADVGDRANDAIRVDGTDLRARIVGEGGNLGCTQLGRIEFALTGGRLNTDAIDNSAGVDTSDHEVNIKILLDAQIRIGRLDPAERTDLLASMTDEVGTLVLRDNYSQNLALSCSSAQAADMIHVHTAYLDWLEKNGQLVRGLEYLPDAETLAQRRSAGIGLTRPELALLLALAKIGASHELAGSDIAEDDFAQRSLRNYFPTAVQERFGAALDSHPLRREIVATALANQVVNLSGTTFVFRVASETAASTAEIVRAHAAARAVFDVDGLWAALEALDDVVDSGTQAELLLGVRQLLDRATRWFLANRRPPIDVDEVVQLFSGGVRSAFARLTADLRARNAAEVDAAVAALVDKGLSPELAARIVALPEGVACLSIVDIALDVRRPVPEVADVHFAVGETLGLSQLALLVAALPRDSRWHTLARAAARDDLQAAHTELTSDVLTSTSADVDAQERVLSWQQANSSAVGRASSVVDDILAGDGADLATLSVALREVRALVRAASLPARPSA